MQHSQDIKDSSMTLAQLYETLTSLPLFRGMSAAELNRVSEEVKLRWLNLVSDQPFIHANEPCNHLVYLLEGTLTRTQSFDNDTYSVSDLVKGPCLIEPEQLYGLTCAYQANYRTASPCRFLLISKDDVRRCLHDISIWRINLFNLYASTLCKERKKTEPKPYDLKEQIMHFGSERPIRLHIRMADLARYMGVSRTTISHALHELEDQGKVRLSPNQIEYK